VVQTSIDSSLQASGEKSLTEELAAKGDKAMSRRARWWP